MAEPQANDAVEDARRALEEAEDTMEKAHRRWPEVRLWRSVARNEREANGFGENTARMFAS
jgi:hypothetical protein